MAFKGNPHHHHGGSAAIRWLQKVSIAVAGIGLLASGCSDEPSGPNPESMQVVGVRSIQDVRVNGSYVSPDGSAWIYRGDDDDELCVGLQAEPDAEPTCAPWDRSVSAFGVGWSRDAKRVLVTEDFYVRLDESDVSVFDVESGRIEVLTQDDADEIGDDRAEIDISPFFGPNDEIFFFRYGNDRSFALYQLVDGQAEAVEGGQLRDGWFPDFPAFTSEKNVWTFGYSEGGKPAGYATLTFKGSGADTKVSVDGLWEPGNPGLLADVAGDTLLVTRPFDRAGDNFSSVVKPGERASVDLVAEDLTAIEEFSLAGGRLSSDGKYVLELRPNAEGVRFTLWRLESDGDTLTAEPTQVGTVTDERLGAGVGEVSGKLGWDGGTTLTAIGRAGLVVFDVTLDEE